MTTFPRKKVTLRLICEDALSALFLCVLVLNAIRMWRKHRGPRTWGGGCSSSLASSFQPGQNIVRSEASSSYTRYRQQSSGNGEGEITFLSPHHHIPARGIAHSTSSNLLSTLFCA